MLKAYQICEVVTFLENKKRSRSTIESNIRGYKEANNVEGVENGCLHDFLEFKYLPARKEVVEKAKKYDEEQLLFDAHNYCLKYDVKF